VVDLTGFELFALGCGLVGLSGIAAISFGGWEPRSRLVVFALFGALGLAIGTAIGRLLAFSIVVFLGLLAIYVVARWILRRRAQLR
jgi:hypothetical protein